MRNMVHGSGLFLILTLAACNSVVSQNPDGSGEDAVCGNGLIESGELCDGEDLADQTCVTLGYDEGNLACSNTCSFDRSACVADIAVTDVSGTWTEGSLLTISGIGFGSTGPTVVIFDDFEGGTNGAVINADAAMVGAWDGVASTGSPSPSAYYSNSSAVSGNLAFRSNQYDGVSRLDLDFGNQTEMFGTWWIRHEGTDWPHDGGSTPVVNWKTVWLWELELGVAGGNDVILPGFSGGISNPPSLITGNQTAFGAIWSPFGSWGNNIWRRVAVYLHIDQDTGYGDFDFWTYAEGDGPWHQTISRRDEAFSVPGHAYRGLGMNGYAYAGNPNSHPMFDDFYWAVGQGAQARVEIGDDPSYENCNQLAILIAESWSDTSISARMRTTQFASASSFYLFVVGADGIPSHGFPITVP